MELAKVLLLFTCIAFSFAQEDLLGRSKRQLNGAHFDAIDRSANGGFKPTFNPMLNPSGFGGRIGGGYGGNVWSSGRQSVGLGAAARADVGLNGGRPFVRTPEVGVGATYNRGPNSFSLGAGKTFGSRPSNNYGFTYSRRFRRSVDEPEEHQLPEVEHDDEDIDFDDAVEEDVTVTRNKRQAAMDAAVQNSLTNKPVGHPQFSYQVDAAGNSMRNFGASGSAGAGVKMWERGPHSVGLGVGVSRDLARINGHTYTGNQQLGAGLGYQNGGFSATLGAGRTLGRFPSNHYGLNLGYRFKRALRVDDNDDDSNEVFDDQDQEIDDDDDTTLPHRQRRQAPSIAAANTFTDKGVFRPQFSYQVDAAGRSFRNLGGTGSVGVGTKVWERGPHSVGVGVGASTDFARINGNTYTGNYQVGAGVGYHHRNGFSTTLGVGQGVGQFRSKPYGMLQFQYRG